jgi:hypothetical protein
VGAVGSLVILDRKLEDGLLALFVVGSFAVQHRAAASRAARSGIQTSQSS